MRAVIRHDEDVRGTAIYFVKEIDGKRYVAQPLNLTFVPMEDGKLAEPTLGLDPHEGTALLKSMVDQLAMIGISANELEVKNSQLRAVQYHLEDMRSMVFKGKAPVYPHGQWVAA